MPLQLSHPHGRGKLYTEPAGRGVLAEGHALPRLLEDRRDAGFPRAAVRPRGRLLRHLHRVPTPFLREILPGSIRVNLSRNREYGKSVIASVAKQSRLSVIHRVRDCFVAKPTPRNDK